MISQDEQLEQIIESAVLRLSEAIQQLLKQELAIEQLVRHARARSSKQAHVFEIKIGASPSVTVLRNKVPAPGVRVPFFSLETLPGA